MKPLYLRKIPDHCKRKFESEMFYQRFGHLRVLGISNQTDSTNVHFCICVCDCGRLFHTRKESILKGRTKSCCGYVSLQEEQDRLKSRTNCDENDCWILHGNNYKRSSGAISYGRFESKLFPDEYLAHRVSFLLFKGKIPKGAYICHLCDVESCVNPDHLFLGDHKINTMDMMAKDRQARGERNANAKYTNEIVSKCRKMHENGDSYSVIGKKMNIPKSTIANFISEISWKHINLD